MAVKTFTRAAAVFVASAVGALSVPEPAMAQDVSY